ncbi:ABC transporter ATP-binding protein [Limnobacter sp.]|jgi:ATP-binding cassette, subfamily B, bacterial PglK|uniref:ABC transporter ATP-binding protein n=1 Tax=Limnobacter sp. TaxID=2003368 RepID=UPI0027BAE0A8|nr:ABC transporter ATP-binding protein [Limnobacter sp.]
MTRSGKSQSAHSEPITSSIHGDLGVVWRSLEKRWRIRFWGLMILSLFASISEVLSIGSLLPFLAVLAAPEQLLQWPLLGRGLSVLNLGSAQALIIAFGLVFGGMVLVASLIRWWLAASCLKFSYQVGGAIGQDIFRRALLQPYAFHLDKTSSEIIDVITTRVQIVVNSVFMAGLQLITSAVMVLAIAMVLLWLNPVLAGTALLGFALVYLFIFGLRRRRLKANSARMSQVGTTRYQLLQEGIGGIRDIKIDGSHDYFIRSFKAVDDAFRQSQSQNAIISASPRYLVEGFGTLLLAILAVVYATQTGDADTLEIAATASTSSFVSLLPMLGVLVMATQRVLPMLQQIYAGWTGIHGVAHTLNLVGKWLQIPLPATVPPSVSAAMEVDAFPKSSALSISVELKDVSFSYQPGSTPIIDKLNLVIRKGQTVGLVGATGVGKSTLLDMLMGLFEPNCGQVLIDSKPLGSSGIDAVSPEGWRRQIAHVPQHIFLADTSIAHNIAFGLPANELDYARIEQAVDQAQLADFIRTLPQGLNTIVGERGVRLSGGQRQRIGIARALYKSATFLVLDEATSALDSTTEEIITQSLAKLSSVLTIVMVSHRPSALKHCDVIYQLELGQLAPQKDLKS